MLAGLLAPVLLVTVLLPSQVGRLWTFDQLVAESDVVVIGVAIASRDTGRKGMHPELRPGFPVVEIETGVQVLAILKGQVEADTTEVRRLVIHHYRLDVDEWRRHHPPTPGQPPRGLVNAGEPLVFKTPEQTYLFFLTRGARGWEPTTGHTFPSQSVFPLEGANRLSR